ncbi:MAG TPA: universal stress protein, partial [Gaiellaceae bacterium]|nr:universal stress protein [Gaiellaceae bacterium]
MERIAITARLRPGREEHARELLKAGPPFDPGRVGFNRHSVFLASDLVVFVFEGEGLGSRLSGLINDPLRAAAFAAWGPVLAERPRLAHETYHWDVKEDTMKKILIATDGSPYAHEAVRFGLDLAAEHGAEPVFVHVAPALDVLPGAGLGFTTPGAVHHELTEHDRAPPRRGGGDRREARDRREDGAARRECRGRDRGLRGHDRRRPDRRRLARARRDRERAARQRLARRAARGAAAGARRPRHRGPDRGGGVMTAATD